MIYSKLLKIFVQNRLNSTVLMLIKAMIFIKESANLLKNKIVKFLQWSILTSESKMDGNYPIQLKSQNKICLNSYQIWMQEKYKNSMTLQRKNNQVKKENLHKSNILTFFSWQLKLTTQQYKIINMSSLNITHHHVVTVFSLLPNMMLLLKNLKNKTHNLSSQELIWPVKKKSINGPPLMAILLSNFLLMEFQSTMKDPDKKKELFLLWRKLLKLN